MYTSEVLCEVVPIRRKCRGLDWKDSVHR